MTDQSIHKERNFLALTSLEEGWDTARPMYFLGEWCRQYARTEYWKTLDAIVIEPTQFQKISHYEYHLKSIEIYEELLPHIAENLNKFHNTHYSLHYWRHLIGSFLFWYIEVVYDRFLYLKTAYEINPNFETYGLSQDYYLTFININELLGSVRNSATWNLQLFTQILDFAFKRPIKYLKISRSKDADTRKTNYDQSQYRLHTRVFILLTKMIARIRKNKVIGILNVYFSRYDFLKLMFKSQFKIFPVFSKKPLNKGQTLGKLSDLQNQRDFSGRKFIFDIVCENTISQLIIHTLQTNMPTIYIEQYHEEKRLSKYYFPLCCAIIVTEQCASHDQYKFWMAEQMEKGSYIIATQHGGAYGMQQGHPGQFSECDVSHFFISWGWSYSNNVIAASTPCHSNKTTKYCRNAIEKEKNEIIWVATVGGMDHSIGFCNWLLTQEAYLSMQEAFFTALDKNISEKIVMRASPTAYCQQQVQDRFKNLKIKIPVDRNDFFSHVSTAKIVVIDHPSTSFLFVLALNIPTILFWHEQDFPMCDEAAPHMQYLQDARVLHYSAMDAAKWLNGVADDPYPWWNSQSVQSARQQFCNQFIRTSPNYLTEWRDILLGLYKQQKISAKT